MLTARFIRHAESLANAGTTTVETTVNDIPLSPKGLQQAQEFAESVQESPELIVYSPYIRTQFTAAPLIEKFPTVPVQVWPVQEFTYLSAAKFNHLSKEGRRVLNQQYWARLEPIYNDGDNAESFVDLIGRAQDCLLRLESLSAQGIGRVLIISHAGFLKALRMVSVEGHRAADVRFMHSYMKSEMAETIPNMAGFTLFFDETWKMI